MKARIVKDSEAYPNVKSIIGILRNQNNLKRMTGRKWRDRITSVSAGETCQITEIVDWIQERQQPLSTDNRP